VRISPDRCQGADVCPLSRLLAMTLVVSFLLPLLLLASGCARKHAPAPGRRPDALPGATAPTARPYTVLGQTYHPLTTADGFTEEGMASWYGPQFHAKRTASGEVYNMYELTAAHRILPMQTKIKVTNLENGKTIVLRVNDRGPFAKNRIVDLSYAAAQELDVIRPGTARVRVEALGRWPGGIPGRFFVQVGAFIERENAGKLMREMQNAGYPGTRMVLADVQGQRFWRVQAGEFKNLDLARKALNTLASRHPAAFVIAD